METAATFATDPVCGMAVEVKPGALSAERDGSVHYFCCSGCREQFLAGTAA
jgi:YHS domain-containing protein